MLTTLALSIFFLGAPPVDPWLVPLVPAEDPSYTAEFQETPGVWANRPDEEWLREIQTSEIVSIAFNRGGSSISLRLQFANGASAAFKPDQFHEQTVPRYEIAAYRINRLLGLSRVPPATWRVLSKKEIFDKLDKNSRPYRRRLEQETAWREDGTVAGEVSVWVPVIRYIPLDTAEYRRQWVRWLMPFEVLDRNSYSLAGQISIMNLFDFLLNNPDRYTGNNTIADERMRHLYFMDNTWSFYPAPDGSTIGRVYLRLTRRYSERMIRALRRFDESAVRKHVLDPSAPWVIIEDREIAALMARRDLMLREITRNIAQYGWEKTVVFP